MYETSAVIYSILKFRCIHFSFTDLKRVFMIFLDGPSVSFIHYLYYL